MELKDILRELRTQKKLTQSEIAERIGLKTNTYQSYEHGSAEPSCSTLKALADFYGVTTDYLLGREPAPNPFADLNLSTEDEQEVFEKYMSLPENIRAVLLDVLIQLADAARARRAGEIIEETTVGAELDRRAADDAEAEETAV